MDRAPAMARSEGLRRRRRASRSWAIFPLASATTAPTSSAQPDRFALDWSGGAPPEPYFKDDDFTQKWGQNWGIPLYRWDVMRANIFDWWRQRVRGVRQIFHVFRIDHVIGFFRIYAFPWRPERNADFLPLTWDEMLRATGGRFPHFAPRDDETHEHADANRRRGRGISACGPG